MQTGIISAIATRGSSSGWDWWQFRNDAGAAIVGGVVGGLAGGGIAGWVAIRQTQGFGPVCGLEKQPVTDPNAPEPKRAFLVIPLPHAAAPPTSAWCSR